MHCRYLSASGVSYADCVFIGRRWRDEYGTNLSDSDFWIVVTRPEPPVDVVTRNRWGPTPAWLLALWRAIPSGIVYVCDTMQPAMLVYDDVNDNARPPRTYELDFAPEGVWGLDDQHVYAWGTGKDASNALEYPIARWDGNDWRRMPSPGFAVTNMHGIAPDLIYACGWRGGMARWDGRAWNVLPMPTGEVFSDVYVEGPDEMYATGNNGSLLEGSASGWGLIARTIDDRFPYTCVRKFAGELWVGGGKLGLFRRKGKTNELENFKPKITATAMESRSSLIITCENKIAGTSDGQSFRSTANDHLLNTTGHIDIAE
jgi:hypothetical protein